MKMEQERGISVSASAMSFDFGPYRFNLVDTPGHSDFSEDTYRTLTAVDSVILVIDSVNGVEAVSYTHLDVYKRQSSPLPERLRPPSDSLRNNETDRPASPPFFLLNAR